MNTLTKSLAAFVLLTGTLLSAGPSQAGSAVVLPAPAPAQSALNALLAAPNSPLPDGTKLLSIRIENGMAIADFSREMRDDFSGGDTAETRAVNAVLWTLGQFPTVSRVQILVEGQPVDSLGGLLLLSDPLPVIRPDAAGSSVSGQRFHRTSPQASGQIRRERGKTQKRAMPAADAR